MSAPSQALFFKDDELVRNCFINCGWFYSEERTLEQILDYLQKHPSFEFDRIKAYGVIYYLDEHTWKEHLPKCLQILKEQRIKIAEETKQRLKEIAKTSPRVVFPTLKTPIPNMIADQIINVQPMTQEAGQIFTIVKGRNDLDIMSDPNYMHVEL